MARQTAAQKLAAQEAAAAEEAAAAAAAEAEGGTPPPAAEPEKKAPVTAPYTLFGYITATADNLYGGGGGGAWVQLGDEVQQPTYQHAMEVAKDRLRDKILGAATEEAPAPPTLKLTVAAIASKNWNQGTAIVELRPVTTWEK